MDAIGTNIQAPEKVKKPRKPRAKKIKAPEIYQVNLPDGRFYETVNPNGDRVYYPSVTTVLKCYFESYLSQWRGSVGNQEADRIFREAGDMGTSVHRYFNDVINGVQLHYQTLPQRANGFVIQDPLIWVQLYRLCEFMRVVQPEVLMAERMVVSHSCEYAGTLDLLLKIKAGRYNVNGSQPVDLKGGIYLADIKTSNSFHDNNYWQVAAYAFALMEENVNIDGTMILHTKSMNKGGINGFSCKVRTRDEMGEDFLKFMAVKRVFDINAPRPSIQEVPVLLSKKLWSN